jgi:hypothetical protein
MITTEKLHNTEIYNSIEQLPIATKQNITTESGVTSNTFQAIVVNDKIVSVLTNKYRLVQHKEAFTPIISSLEMAGIKKYDYILSNDDKKATIDIYTQTARDDKEGVEFGFRCQNSFDGRSAIKFDFKMTKAKRWVELVERDEVTVWGFRLACKNGMMIKVPLAFEKVVRAEERSQISELMRKSQNIAHFKNSVERGLEEVKTVVEAMTLLQKPIERMIAMANQYSLEEFDKEDIMKIIKKYIGKKMSSSIYDQYVLDNTEKATLWGLFNAVTNVATHKKSISNSTRNKLMEKSAYMLEAEITTMVA